MGQATFLAIFSQTHLVTLILMDNFITNFAEDWKVSALEG
jgi:hypothetical protein